MRVLLVGRPRDRDRLRPHLIDAGFEVVAESIEQPSLSVLPNDIDAIVVASTTDSANGPVPPSLARVPVANFGEAGARDELSVEALTTRELEVLAHLAEGLPNKAIAAALGISDQTVKFHVAAIIAKLGAANRTEAVRRAVRRGLVVI